MRKIIATILGILPLLISAQDIQVLGIVRELNSDKRPIANVRVVFEDAVPTISGTDGRFELLFPRTKSGYPMIPKEISKRGFEIVNTKELQSLRLGSSKESRFIDIIMAPQGTIDSLKVVYYNISLKALEEGYSKQIRGLEKQLDSQEITRTQYEEELKEEEKRFQRQLIYLRDLAEKFARTNFDDVSQLYKEAFDLFKAGKIEEAIKKLEDAKLLEQADSLIAERDRIKKAKEYLEKWAREVFEQKNKDIKALFLLAQMYESQNAHDTTAQLYTLILQYDSTNPPHLMHIAQYFQKQNQSDRAIEIYQRFVQGEFPEHKWIGEGEYQLGILYQSQKQFPKALSFFKAYASRFDSLLRYSPNASMYLVHSCRAQLALSHMYMANKDVTNASSSLQQANQVFAKIDAYTLAHSQTNSLLTHTCFQLAEINLAYARQIEDTAKCERYIEQCTKALSHIPHHPSAKELQQSTKAFKESLDAAHSGGEGKE